MQPDPDVPAREIVEELEAALEQFAGIVEEQGGEESKISPAINAEHSGRLQRWGTAMDGMTSRM